MVGDALWESVSPLLPTPATRAKGGRPRAPDRAALAGIVYVLRTGIPWNMLPADFGCSGVTWAEPFAGVASGNGREPASGDGC
ncbi:MAG: hypothetical protein AVDCRST_MAG12-8 [uncultured Rubrobacteraceae bacterium]|uniref:Insertion element IS402-like domain-containing protein n=1 Tax=uncultured Rubrobacteraceae bacterium TaxID=349277 RepID=A0A6J4R8P4_9ACTN|nr:MAG: hypothetical protein AVDCRST_MAG12-8 [uncultured Rubrobacteraceae bacterium]